MSNTYAKKKRQYNYLVKRINQLIAADEWQTLSEDIRRKFETRLRRLYQALSSAFNQKSLIKAMGVAALVLGYSTSGLAQSFNQPLTNPFSLTATGYFGLPTFVDIDDDGDLDLFDIDVAPYSYSVNVAYRQNTGTSTNPIFGTQSINPFGLQASSTPTYKSTFADLDNDGDYDIMRTTYYGDHLYYQNTGTKTSPQFAAPVTNPFGLAGTGDISVAVFVDLDADGDFDLMHGSYYGDFMYFENTGTKTAPQFGTMQTNPFGLPQGTSNLTFPDFTDLDGDGDLDMMTIEYYGDFHYYQNTGSKTAPAFGVPSTNPFGLANVYSYPAFLCFADLDGDTDDDIMLHDYYGDYLFYQNNSGFGVGENLLTGITVYPNPAHNKLTVDLTSALPDLEIEILDLTGRTVYRQMAETTRRHTVDVSDLPRGIYMVKLQSEDRQMTERLVLK